MASVQHTTYNLSATDLARPTPATLAIRLVKPSSVGKYQVSVPTEAEHEANVKAFLSSAERKDPVGFAALAEKYPTLSRTHEDAIRAREVSAFSPEDEAGEFLDGSSWAPDFSERLESLRATAQASMMATPLRP
jgi:hypothetical protein